MITISHYHNQMSLERATKQRAAVRDVIAGANRPLTPKEILEIAKPRVPGLGIATVYRAVKGLTDEGAIRAVDLPTQGSRYEAAHGHHHHFQCRKCDRVFDVHGCPGHLPQMALPPGFVVDDHEVTLYGRCGDCAS